MTLISDIKLCKRLEDGTNNGAEIQALISDIKLCKRLGFGHIIIETYSELVVNWGRNNIYNAWYLWDIWDQLLHKLTGSSFLISHTHRGNQIVDLLARRGERGTSQIYMAHEDLPKEVPSMINFD